MWFSKFLFRGTAQQAWTQIQQQTKDQWYSIVSFLYFAQAMKFRVYENHNDTSPLHQNDTTNNYIQAMKNADFVLIDGIAMQIFDRVGQFIFWDKRSRSSNLNGTDFLPYILEQTKDQKVAIIMSSVYDPKINKWPEWMDKWLNKLKSLYPHIDIIFKHQTVFAKRGEDFPLDECIALIQKKKSDYDHILFLNGIWGPAQEIRTEQKRNHFKDTNIIVMNNGATIDYYSGFETRAPRRVVKMRIGETFRRIITQPEKNLKKFLVMFRIIPYRGYLITKSIKKVLNNHKTSWKS